MKTLILIFQVSTNIILKRQKSAAGNFAEQTNSNFMRRKIHNGSLVNEKLPLKYVEENQDRNKTIEDIKN